MNTVTREGGSVRAPVVLFCVAMAALAVTSKPTELPQGTNLSIRLTKKISTADAKEKSPVEAVLLAPVIINGALVVPAGSKVLGQVAAVTPAKPATEDKPEERASLRLSFDKIVDSSGTETAISGKVTQVDNAREKLAEDGAIQGIQASETISKQMDRGIEKLAEKYGSLASILDTARKAVIKDPDTQITYEPGVEMTLQLAKAAQWKGATGSSGYGQIGSIEPAQELVEMVNAQPFQTTAVKPPKPSDMTNLMYLGSEEVLTAVFHAAGWSTAAELNARSGLETFRSIAENRGYSEAPMSVLLLDGQKPDLTFQKQNNTFAMRHHLRVWKRPVTFQGRQVWVCAATHDIGIQFSPENRTFIHLVEHEIDKERGKVMTDLLFSGKVKGVSLVGRPEVPQKSMNATGDELLTDGCMGVLLLQ